MNEIGALYSVSKLTNSHASSFKSNSRINVLFNACPDLCPLNAPIKLCPSKY